MLTVQFFANKIASTAINNGFFIVSFLFFYNYYRLLCVLLLQNVIFFECTKKSNDVLIAFLLFS